MGNSLVQDDQCIAKFSPESAYATVKVLPTYFIGAIIVAGALYFNIPYIAFAGIGLWLYGIYKYYYIRTIKYYLTEEQIIVHQGIISTRTDYLELYRITDLLALQPLWLRLFGLMHVKLITFDSNERMLLLKGIKQSDIPNTIREYVQKCRKSNKILTVDRPYPGIN